MTSSSFTALAHQTLTQIDEYFGELDPDRLDVELAGDVMNLCFNDGTTFVLNAHGAAGQIWLAAGTSAWHFDPPTPAQAGWVAAKNGDELHGVLCRVVGEKLGMSIPLPQAP